MSIEAKPGNKGIIYHLAPESEFRDLIHHGEYAPALFEKDHFIHCTEKPSTLLKVANDYFSKMKEAIVVVEINTSSVLAEVKFEAPAPVAGAGMKHSEDDVLFPHIYGSLNVSAVTGIGHLQKVKAEFIWPQIFISYEKFMRP